MEDIQEWAETVGAYHRYLLAAMPGASESLVNELVVDWQRLMIERVRNAPDVINLNLSPGPETAHTISRYLVRAVDARRNRDLASRPT